MKRLFCLILTVSSVLWAQVPELSAPQQPEVFLLGTMHEYHFQERFHYSLADLGREVESLRPEVICGEIAPEAYNSVMEGYFPPEAAYLAEIAPSLKARFIPADWRISYGWQHRASQMEPAAKVKLIADLDQKQQDGITQYDGISVFDYLHSNAFIGVSEEKFEHVIGENTISDLAAGGWHERNRRIVENCLDRAGAAHRIAIVFGANHIEQLKRQLAEHGITAQIAKRQFTPDGLGTVSLDVLARWQRNLENLQAIQEGRVGVSRDALNKVRDSHRVRDLELAIESYTPRS
jgi:hypothetical protein